MRVSESLNNWLVSRQLVMVVDCSRLCLVRNEVIFDIEHELGKQHIVCTVY